MKKEKIRGRELADLVVACADSKKAENIALVNPSEEAGIADWFVICQGDNTSHNRAIADAIIDGLKEKGAVAWHVEGLEDGRWVLVDLSDVVVHVMLPELRERYALEDLWSGKVKRNPDGDK